MWSLESKADFSKTNQFWGFDSLFLLKHFSIHFWNYLLKLFLLSSENQYHQRIFGGGDADAPLPQGFIRPPTEPKGPAFVLFWVIHFWLTDPKVFLKALKALILREEGAKKDAVFRFKKSD